MRSSCESLAVWLTQRLYSDTMLKHGPCRHPHNLSLCLAGEMDPTIVISHIGPIDMAPHFYKIFDGKQDEVRARLFVVMLICE